MKISLIRSKIHFLFLLLVIFLSLIWLPFQVFGEQPDFAGGIGTKEDPYQIATADQLNNVRNYLNAHFKLIADIDLAESSYNQGDGWEPIGPSIKNSFKGTFDGNDHKIKNLFINRSDQNYIGLFGVSTSGSVIRNVELENVDVTGGDYVGSLVGYNNHSTITDTYVTGTLNGTNYVGGLVGYILGGSITNSSSTVSVSGKDNIGGLMGYNYEAKIADTYAIGTVSGSIFVGGLIGGVAFGDISNVYALGTVSGTESIGGLIGGMSYGTITKTYATGTASGTNKVGGLVGEIYYATISDTYTTASVSGTSFVGGLIGQNYVVTITNSYVAGTVSGFAYVGALAGYNYGSTITSSYYDKDIAGPIATGEGKPKSTEEMKQRNTFEGWDFDNVWHMLENQTYPRLQWEDYSGFSVALEEESVKSTGESFNISIADAKGIFGNVLNGDIQAIVTSNLSSEEVYNDIVTFHDGNAVVPITLDKKGLHRLIIQLEGITNFKSLEVEADTFLKSIEITSPPSKTQYFVDESLDLEGLIVTGIYTDGSQETLSIMITHISGYDSSAPAKDQVITVSYEGKTATFTVDIVEPELEKIEVTSPPNKTTYFVDEAIDLTGLEVTGYYSDGKNKLLPNAELTISGYDSNAPAKDQVVTVSYEGKTATFTVDIVEPELEKIEVTSPPDRTTYFVDEAIDLTGLEVTGYYSDGKNKLLPIDQLTISGYDSSTPAKNQVVTVSYEGKTATFTVNIVEPELEKIEVTSPPDRTTYFVDEAIDLTGLEVTGYYSDGKNKLLPNAELTISGYDSSTPAKNQVVTVSYEGKTATFTVDIVEPELEKIEITSLPNKTEYFVGEELDKTGLVVTGYYTDGSKKTLPIDQVTISDYDSSTPAKNQVLTVSYEGKTATFTVDIVEPELEKIEVTSPPNKTEYFVGEELDKTGLVVTGYYTDGSKKTLPIDQVTISDYDSSTPAKNQVVTVSYEGKTATFTVDIVEPELEKIEITSLPNKTEYFVGEELDKTGLVVTGYYTDGSKKTLPIDQVTISDYDSSTPAKDQVITVSYEGKTATFTVDIVEPELEKIEITSLPNKTEYFVGEELDKTGLVVTGYYTDGSKKTLPIDQVTISDYDSSTPAKNQVLTVSYEGKTAIFTVDIVEPELEKIEITSLPNKTEYFVGEELDKTGLVVTGYYTDGSKKTLPIDQVTISDYDSSTPAKNQVLTVSYEGKTATFTVDIVEPELEKIEITSLPNKTEYFVGEELDKTGLVVTGYYTDGSKKTLPIDQVTISDYDSSAPAKNQVVTVSYEGKTATFTVNIVEPELEKIEITSLPNKTEYFVGEDLDITGLVVKGIYSDSSEKELTITMSHITGFDSSNEDSAQEVTINYEGKTATFTVTIKRDTEAPTIPANLRSTNKTTTSISLAWDEALDNVGVSHYEIEMKQGTGSWQQIGSNVDTTYTKTSLVPSTSYTFRVRAVDGAGNLSDWSDELVVSTSSVSTGGGGYSGGSNKDKFSELFIDINGSIRIAPSEVDTSKPTVTLQVDPKDKDSGYVSIPATILTDFAKVNQKFVIEIEAPYGSYLLPVTLPSLISDWEKLLEENNWQAENIGFKLTLTDKTENSEILENLSLQLPNGKLAGTILNVHLEMVDIKTGKVLTGVKEFTEPIIRMIPISGELTADSTTWGAFRYDDESGKFVFVPARLEERDGRLYAVIRSYSNSVYVAVSNTVSFTDMKRHWAKADIERAGAKGLVFGTGNGKFTPDKMVTRAEFTALLVRAIGPAANNNSDKPVYKDVQQGAWYYDVVAQAKELGLLDFIEGERFLPNQPLTREEMARMVATAVRLKMQNLPKKSVNLNTYRDRADMDEAYIEDIELMVRLGIMNGTKVDHFSPKGKTTRAQATVVLLRTLRVLDWMD